MRCRIPQKRLLAELDFVKSIFASKAALSAAVTLTTDSGKLELSAHSGTRSMRAYTEAISPVHGTCSVSGPVLMDICRLLTGEVLLERQDGRVLVSADGYEAKIPLANNPFTPPSAENLDRTVRTDAAQLLRLLDRVQFAAGYTAYTSNILLEQGTDFLQLVATDGHRMALASLGTKGADVVQAQILIDLLGDVRKVLQSSETVAVEYGSSGVRIAGESRQIFARATPAPFPNYERIVPKGLRSRVRVYTKSLCAAAKRMLAADADNDPRVAFAADIPNDELILSVKGSRERLQLLGHEHGDELKAWFNTKYVRDAAEKIETEFCEIHAEQDKPCLVVPVAPDGYSHSIVIMPLRPPA